MKSIVNHHHAVWIYMLMFIVFISCKKEDPESNPVPVAVTLPRLELYQGIYYKVGCDERSIEMEFSEAPDPATVQDNIVFSESGHPLQNKYTLQMAGRKVVIGFLPDFFLKEGWQYMITIRPGLRTIPGNSFPEPYTIEIRSGTLHPLVSAGDTNHSSIVCISDLHMNNQRASTCGYSSFGQNAAALDSLLSGIMSGNRVKQLVIVGDFFDEWAVPYRLNPHDPAAGIHSSRDYFLSVASNPVNSGIIGKLRQIATSGKTRLIYVPGNHDMLLTEATLQEIIPGIEWKGDATGLGSYSPADGIITEHGHRCDFFNCPQPLTRPGHILPPGYFVTRLDAEGLYETSRNQPKSSSGPSIDLTFLAAWAAVFAYLEVHYTLTVAPDSANILMGGIDGYPGPEGFNAVRDTYAANIEEVWPATQVVNKVPVSIPVAMAIANGNSDLYAIAALQYMQSPSPVKYRIVVFGHSHHAMIKVYPAGSNYTAIYGNTGTWINEQLTTHPVRTFIEIRPGAWNGSPLDVVSLYQYNPVTGNSGSAGGFAPVLLNQESLVAK